jgi:hypothetical protein
VGILVIVSLSIGVVYGIRTYILTQSIGGFPGGSTNIWVLGSNSTLTSNIPNPPPVGSNGTLPLYTTNIKITCGEGNSCSITVTVTGLPSGWSFAASDTPAFDGVHQNFGFSFLTNGSQSVFCPAAPCDIRYYQVSYINYPASPIPGINIQYSWTV